MGFLMFAGLIGTIAYSAYYAKNEARAIIGDSVITPTQDKEKDKQIIENNFQLICKRCNIKLDNQGYPLRKNSYNPCLAYLQYQGFQPDVADYFKEIFLQKYNNKHETNTHSIQLKHNNLSKIYYDNIDKTETKIFRYWHSGDTEKKCQKLMNNWLWSDIVDHYNIVRDGYNNVEVWVISAPPSILKQISTIYNEVCFLEGITNNI